MLKKNIKLIIGIIIGIIISGSIVYAVNIASSSISYTRSGSSVTDVEGALNELYNLANIPKCFDGFICETIQPIYFEYGYPSISSSTNYLSLNRKVFIGLDNSGSKAMCIYMNSKLHCFKNNNIDIEKQHILQVFSKENCNIQIGSTDCSDNNYSCSIHANGYVNCGYEASDYCFLSYDESIGCS